VAEALRAELRLLGFDDPPSEVAAYLQQPKQYRSDFETRVVAQLVLRGRKARESRDVPTATAAFNRALAYRPDDADLIAEVSSLARNERFRRALVQGAVILTGSLIIAAALGGVFKLVAKARGMERKKATAAASANKVAGPVVAPVPGRPGSSAEPVAPPRKKKRQPKAPEPPKEVVPETANVRVALQGPANATVLVDGQPFGDWFGKAHELAVGQHTFEFRPPDAQCCVGSTFKTVNIRAPEKPTDEVTINGVIEFNPAILEFRGAPLSTASCGEFGTFAAPGSLTIKMSKPRVSVRCNVIPAPQSGDPPKQFDVELIPGRTSSFPRLP
jgi:hypothetical protein